MPEICRFLGIVIFIYYNDHSPPHFHVEYNEYRAVFSIESLTLLDGKLPKRVISLVLEWAFLHREELIADWKLAQAKAPLNKIKPLV